MYVRVSLSASVLERWCRVLENRRSPESPEVLRMACAEALCAAGVSLSLRERCRAFVSRWEYAQPSPSKRFDRQIVLIKSSCRCRLIGTGLCLLQDQSQRVRMKAAHFTSLLRRARRGGSREGVYVMQVNKALQVLLDLLLEECWDDPRTLELLLSNLPQSDLRSLEHGASGTG